MESKLVLLTAKERVKKMRAPLSLMIADENEVIHSEFFEDDSVTLIEAYIKGIEWFMKSRNTHYYVACNDKRIVEAINENSSLYPNIVVYYVSSSNAMGSILVKHFQVVNEFYENFLTSCAENAPKNLIVYATDASRSRNRGVTTWAWVSNMGHSNMGKFDAKNINEGEFVAIVNAVKSFKSLFGDGAGVDKCVIYTDSKYAQNLVKKIKDGVNIPRKNLSKKMKIAVQEMIILSNKVEFVVNYQKAHTNETSLTASLNDCADRIAKNYRYSVGFAGSNKKVSKMIVNEVKNIQTV